MVPLGLQKLRRRPLVSDRTRQHAVEQYQLGAAILQRSGQQHRDGGTPAVPQHGKPVEAHCVDHG